MVQNCKSVGILFTNGAAMLAAQMMARKYMFTMSDVYCTVLAHICTFPIGHCCSTDKQWTRTGRFSKIEDHQHPWFRKSTITIDAAKQKKYKKEKYSEQSATLRLFIESCLFIWLEREETECEFSKMAAKN